MSSRSEMIDKLDGMTDIAARLRLEAKIARESYPEYFRISEKTAEQAADEIDRLRVALCELIDDYEYDSITGLGIEKARAALGEGKE